MLGPEVDAFEREFAAYCEVEHCVGAGNGFDALQLALTAVDVGTLIHYPVPPHCQPAYGPRGWANGCFPLTERLADEVLSLPLSPHVSQENLDYIVREVVASVSLV